MADQVARTYDRFRTGVSVLIAAVTVAGAIVGWRISVANNAAGSADSKGLSAALDGASAAIQVSTDLSMNLQFFAGYQEHLDKAKLLASDAAQESDVTRRASLRDEATRERNLAATSRFYVNEDYVIVDPDTGQETFDEDGFWTASWSEASALKDLDPSPFFARADRLRTKALGLVAVTVGLAVALFLFTASTTTRRRVRYVLAACALPLFLSAAAAAVILELVV